MTRARLADIDDNTRLRRSLTDFIIDVFRLNGALLVSGDALVGDLGLTSALWQVLGAIAHTREASKATRSGIGTDMMNLLRSSR